MILGIQIAGLLFGLFMIYYSFLNYKRREFTLKEFSFWLVLWALFIIVTVFPNVLDPVVKSLNIARTLDLLIISGFIFLITAIFYNYTITRKVQRKLEFVVREMAIKKKKGR